MKLGETRMLDWRGVEVHVGDTVVYPGRVGSSLWMIEGVVTELHSMIEDRVSYEWSEQNGKKITGRPVHLPTQVGGVTVERRYDSGEYPSHRVAPKKVKVDLKRLTVVLPRESMDEHLSYQNWLASSGS